MCLHPFINYLDAKKYKGYYNLSLSLPYKKEQKNSNIGLLIINKLQNKFLHAFGQVKESS